MLTGENGILIQAQRAKNETENAQTNEERAIDDYESYINKVTQTSAVVGEIVTGGNKPYTNNGTVIIPEGFAIVPGFDNGKEGLVISDVENDTEDKGNQFVWVPVENFSEFKRHDFGNQNIHDEYFINTEPTEGKYYEPTPDNTSGCTKETANEVTEMYQSVKDNGGFYIGRYEAGNDGSGNAISQKGVNVYNEIKWGNSFKDETGGAVEKARNFDTQSGHTSVTSTLVYGVQWDAIMRWISEDESLKDYLTDSSDIGNYYDDDSTNNPNKTGANNNYKIKNIYDLAGNISEWTMESLLNSESVGVVVHRGGNYSYNNGIHHPCTFRNYGLPDGTNANTGFRLAFYIR